jgi:hypothetical protein
MHNHYPFRNRNSWSHTTPTACSSTITTTTTTTTHHHHHHCHHHHHRHLRTPPPLLLTTTTRRCTQIPSDIAPGKYILSFRYDCEATAQVWSNCADVTIV